MRDFLVESGLDRLARKMLRAELYAIELILGGCSFWAATRLMGQGDMFDTYRHGFEFMRSVFQREDYWGFIAAIAAVAESIGFSLFMIDVFASVSIFLRSVALVISGFFWVTLGSSYLVGNPDSIAGVPLILLGVSAWWTLLRFPAVPNVQSP